MNYARNEKTNEGTMEHFKFISTHLKHDGIEHSGNEIIMHLDNEVRRGVLQSSIQQTYNLRKFYTARKELTH